MNKSLYFVTFVIGAAAGAFATWQYAKKKYEAIAQEEIDSVKEAFKKSSVKESVFVEEVSSVEKIVADNHYAKIEPNESKDISVRTDYPYVISPDEFGEMAEYEKISLTYYSDGQLADDCDELVDDVDATVGQSSLNHFGEYEDDSVFVRNDRLKCDFEILMDYRKYSDVIERKPHRMED